ncbi:STAS domain-containing protein [Bacillus atrophaeus]|jgi:rsbT co-antagonist protein RsbR|uniref:Positive regulator of sigma-B activity n=1 Tax=Bacillus atrophaeus (strain 1942) TaxID=720555 RepID=A0ABN3Z8H6_BACA1|nr:STAS domain-containing protein [Bacillus atrophaeus]AMR63196.1 modulator protein [Bacillus subtilis subsp. globigii]ADP31882.1 positive regulator of sigma-B activity [Bacillus atrophaeus 1942]AIK47749.1 STAS domain protein [Bacillus atrophaeus subsp. globigii]EIM10410.1 positive regulator of sigma-B activity [Bacillus atrophaeus C89]KFK81549.1 STAS domain protein [Bacillus atrophaeus]
MKDELKYIGEKIVQYEKALAQNVADIEINSLGRRLEEDRQALPGITYREQLITYLGQALYQDMQEVTERISEWSKQTGEMFIRLNVSLSESLRAISFYRTVIWNVFTEELEQRKFAAITMLDVSKMLDPLFDKVSSIIGEVYEQHNNRLMKIAYTALEELSVTVVPVAETIAVIPLVGAIDTHRAKLIMDISLNEGARLKLKHIILDVSGVPLIDTMVADQIFHIVNALRLTGIKAMITGIHPEIAQTIVSLGLDFGDIKTRATLQQALKELGFTQDKM